MDILARLYTRGWKYAAVGVSTFILDIGILYALIEHNFIPYWLAVAIAFMIGLSINFYICYHWVYSGTEREFFHGYFYFVSLAMLGVVIITTGTTLMVELFDLPLLLARTIVGAVAGVIGFFINTFFNFRLL